MCGGHVPFSLFVTRPSGSLLLFFFFGVPSSLPACSFLRYYYHVMGCVSLPPEMGVPASLAAGGGRAGWIQAARFFPLLSSILDTYRCDLFLVSGADATGGSYHPSAPPYIR